MSKRTTILIALLLLALPAAAEAQSVGVSVRIAPRPPQPEMIAQPTVDQPSGASGMDGLSARIPRGWAYSVSAGGGSMHSPRVPAARERGGEVRLHAAASEATLRTSGAPGEPVTVLFVPL